MNEPDRFSVGEVLSASRLNDILDYARPSYAGLPSTGNHIFGSQSANGALSLQTESVILVHATEDFINQTTDSGIVDDVPSGLCDFVRLNRSTNIHVNQVGRPFYVHDVLAELANTSPKVTNDVFYATWNHDSKRWEVIGGGGGGAKRIRFTVDSVVCVGATVVSILARWTHYSGGCGTIPPGVNYEGLIPVKDTCIFSYFTAASLLGKIGSASYWYNRDGYCEGEWLVDDVCGAPECA